MAAAPGPGPLAIVLLHTAYLVAVATSQSTRGAAANPNATAGSATAEEASEAAITTATPADPTVATEPRTRLTAWPPLLGPCNEASFSLDAPSWPLNASWELGPGTSESARAPLAALLQAASEDGVAALSIGPAELGAVLAAVRAGPERFRHGASVRLEVRVAPGAGAAEALASVELRGGEPPPQIRAEGSAELRVRQGSEVLMAVATAEALAACSPGFRSVVITWEYSSLKTPGWISWEAAGGANPALVDASRVPHVLRLAPLLLEPGSKHMFRASAAYTGSTGEWPPPSVVFRLAVEGRAPPRAALLGPSSASARCDFAVEASVSGEEPGGLAFRWSCRPRDPRNARLAEACRGLPGPGAGAGPRLRVAGGHLPEGEYLFALQLRRRGEPLAAEATATLALSLQGGARPPAAVSAPWQAMGHVSLAADELFVSAGVLGGPSGGCRVEETWAWAWSLVEQGRILALLETSVAPSAALEGTVEVATRDFRAGLLVPGRVYSYALLLAFRDIDLWRFRSANGSRALSDVAAAKMSVAASSPPFVADGLPAPGVVTAEPSQGEAVKTAFSLETSRWSDELPAHLEFALFRLPAGIGGSSGLDVEWEDATSPRYWARLGGRMLRGWGRTPSLSGVALPPGEHLLVARARDALGATAAAVGRGPSVAAGALLLAEANATLSSAAASSSFDRLLAATHAVTASGAQGLAADERRSLVPVLWQALEVVLSLAEADAEAAERLAQLLADTVAGGAAEGPAELELACSLLERSLAEVLLGAGKGALLGAASAMLRALAEVHVRLGPPNITALTPVAANSTLAALGTRVFAMSFGLGRALLQSLQAGEAQQLQAEAAVAAGAGVALTISFAAVSLQGLSNATSVGVPGLRVATRALVPNASASACGRLALQRTEWLGANPHRFAPRALGRNAFVAANATVMTVAFWLCGEAVVLHSLAGGSSLPMNSSGGPWLPMGTSGNYTLPTNMPAGSAQPGNASGGSAMLANASIGSSMPENTPSASEMPEYISVRLQVDGPWPPAASSGPPSCLFFDEAAQVWSEEGLSLHEEPVPSAGGHAFLCRSHRGAGSYTLLPEGLPPEAVVISEPVVVVPMAQDSTEMLVAVAVSAGLVLFCFCGFCCYCLGRRCRDRRRKATSRVAASKLEDEEGSGGRRLVIVESRAQEEEGAVAAFKLRSAAAGDSPGQLEDIPSSPTVGQRQAVVVQSPKRQRKARS